MRRGLALLLFFLLFFIPIPVKAQSSITFSNFQIDLWPEYDRPEVLVIYRMTLAPEVTVPAEISLRIPKSAGSPYNVAMQEMDGQLYNLSYSTSEEGDWLQVTFTTSSRDVQIEYYDNTIQKNDTQRTFSYNWPGDYPVANMLVRAQQPAGAEQMQIVPDMGQPTVGDDGLSYYATPVGEVKQGTTFTVKMSYNKATDALSINGLQTVQANAPIRTDASGGLNSGNWLPFLIGAAGLLLLAGGGFWMFWSRERAKVPVTRRRHQTAREETTAAGDSIYCSRCGKRANSGDAFCRACGARLRVE